MGSAYLTLQVDSDEAIELAREATELLKRSPAWLQWLFAEAFERGEEGFDLVLVDPDRDPAAGAHNLRLLAKPTERFGLLVAALRAGNGEPVAEVLFERDLHGGSHA